MHVYKATAALAAALFCLAAPAAAQPVAKMTSKGE